MEGRGKEKELRSQWVRDSCAKPTPTAERLDTSLNPATREGTKYKKGAHLELSTQKEGVPKKDGQEKIQDRIGGSC